MSQTWRTDLATRDPRNPSYQPPLPVSPSPRHFSVKIRSMLEHENLRRTRMVDARVRAVSERLREVRAWAHSGDNAGRSSVSSEEYQFTYTGNDGRKKATFEQALKGGSRGLEEYVDNAPWNFGYQMAEKNLVWHDDLKKSLYARVAAEQLDMNERDIEMYMDQLRALLPDASEKLISMPIKTLNRLILQIDDIPERLMRLKMTFPKANASKIAIRNPELVLGFDPDHLECIAEELRAMFPKLEIDLLVEENPTMLDIEELKVAVEEAKRIMPNLDIQQAMGSDPHLILSFQRGSQLIPYDQFEPEKDDDDEYNQYYQ